MKLKVKLYNKHNYYVIYDTNDKEYGSGNINGRDIREIIKDNEFTIESLWVETSYSYDITIYGIEVK